MVALRCKHGRPEHANSQVHFLTDLMMPVLHRHQFGVFVDNAIFRSHTLMSNPFPCPRCYHTASRSLGPRAGSSCSEQCRYSCEKREHTERNHF